MIVQTGLCVERRWYLFSLSAESMSKKCAVSSIPNGNIIIITSVIFRCDFEKFEKVDIYLFVSPRDIKRLGSSQST